MNQRQHNTNHQLHSTDAIKEHPSRFACLQKITILSILLIATPVQSSFILLENSDMDVSRELSALRLQLMRILTDLLRE